MINSITNIFGGKITTRLKQGIRPYRIMPYAPCVENYIATKLSLFIMTWPPLGAKKLSVQAHSLKVCVFSGEYFKVVTVWKLKFLHLEWKCSAYCSRVLCSCQKCPMVTNGVDDRPRAQRILLQNFHSFIELQEVWSQYNKIKKCIFCVCVCARVCAVHLCLQ